MLQNNEVIAEFPPKLLDMCQYPVRYNVAHGGRAGGKTIAVAQTIVIMGWANPLRVLCAREFQSSISDSCHKNIVDAIKMLNLESFYTIGQQTITGKNGTEIRFAGLKTNISGIRSYAGIDICWIEEASNVSKSSWEVLIPTVRKENSIFFITFNPELETDYTYQSFVVNPRPGSKVVRINYPDNPWFCEPLISEMEYMKRIDDNAYQHVWMGNPKIFLEGAVYANELKAAMNEDRITKVPYDRSQPVNTFWDLGFQDNTSIWFAQTVAKEYRIIDYYENNQMPIQFYIQELQSRGYVYGTHYLPHDARARQLGTGRSIEEIMRGTGVPVHVVPRLSVQDGISAARTIFPNCWFDQVKCTDGIQCLRKYRYDTSAYNQQNPIHDLTSHGADAFRYLAVALKEPKVRLDPNKVRPEKNRFVKQGGWLS